MNIWARERVAESRSGGQRPRATPTLPPTKTPVTFATDLSKRTLHRLKAVASEIDPCAALGARFKVSGCRLRVGLKRELGVIPERASPSTGTVATMP